MKCGDRIDDHEDSGGADPSSKSARAECIVNGLIVPPRNGSGSGKKYLSSTMVNRRYRRIDEG
ncbi:MAG: hypothetical protein JZU55_20685 [Afipia sp.]|jgi:hypothetical protein|nr:hypothetical protein [Afipia sp.]